MRDKIVFGIDPGKNTGLAVYNDGKLLSLYTLIDKIDKTGFLFSLPGDHKLVVIEDSRLQPYFDRPGQNERAQTKIARDIGKIDKQCDEIEYLCEKNGVPLIRISPKGKGAKVDSKQFNAITGWVGRSNQHERDAAMVAWRYRHAKLH